MSNGDGEDGRTDGLIVEVEGAEPSSTPGSNGAGDTPSRSGSGGTPSSSRRDRRMATLRYRAGEAERARDAFARELDAERQQRMDLERRIADMEKTQKDARDHAAREAELRKQGQDLRSLRSKVDASKAKLAAAQENGDAKAIADATGELSQASADFSRAEAEFRAAVDQHTAREKSPAAPATEDQPRVDTTRRDTFYAHNPWFKLGAGGVAENDATRAAQAAHAKIVADGDIVVGSARYFEQIEEEVYEQFPDLDNRDSASGSGDDPATGAAPAARGQNSRDMGRSGGPRTVRLTAEQAAIAKKMKMTLEEYARNMEDF